MFSLKSKEIYFYFFGGRSHNSMLAFSKKIILGLELSGCAQITPSSAAAAAVKSSSLQLRQTCVKVFFSSAIPYVLTFWWHNLGLACSKNYLRNYSLLSSRCQVLWNFCQNVSYLMAVLEAGCTILDFIL